MTYPPPYSDTNDDSGERDRLSTTGAPRWVKAFGLIALALVVLVVILMLAGGHGPGDHAGLGAHIPSA